MCKPFVKWAGGKNQLVDSISRIYNGRLGKHLKKYCEPFVGGGAVLCDVLDNYNVDEVLINDINFELITTYRIIKSDARNLIDSLKSVQNSYYALEPNGKLTMYNELRNEYNKLVLAKTKDEVAVATLFIFLNKTCFNGLYRVNKKGLFNVPIGSYVKPAICDENNLISMSNKLKNVEMRCGDYSSCDDFIDNDTLIYLDPPYRPLTASANFTSYAIGCFDDLEQIRLSEFIKAQDNKGAKIILSNSDPQNIDPNDVFFEDLYSDFKIDKVNARRFINCDGKSRGNITELIITNIG